MNEAADDHPDESDLYYLKSMVAFLFSFARMADKVAGQSYPLRCLILWLFRRAERVAWQCIMGLPAPDWPLGLQRNSPADARLMAKRLRKLAREGRSLLKFMQRYARADEPREIEPSAIRSHRMELLALAGRLLSREFTPRTPPRTPIEREPYLALRFDTF